MMYEPEGDPLLTILDEAPGQTEREASRENSLVATCRRDRHPTLQGRVLAVWTDGHGVVNETWVPCLRGVVAMEGDRLLLAKPENMDEPVVTGILDGLTPRRRAAADGREVRLDADESVKVCLADGTPVLQIEATADGTEIRLLAADADIDLPGKLRICADDIELAARRGEVNLSASGDVKVSGEVVRLN